MGECGCGEIQYHNIVHAVEFRGTVLATEIYMGCEYCHTGLQVCLHLFSSEEATAFGIEATDKLQLEHGYAWLNIPVVDVSDLREALPELTQPTMEHYNSLEDWLEDNGRELLRDGAAIRRHAEKDVENKNDSQS